MDLKQVFNESLKADDFSDGPKSFTITKVEAKEFENDAGGKDVKPVFYFEETPKWLIANKTNTTTIMTNLGTSETDDMTGKKITLKKSRTQFGSKMVDCIRVAEAEEPY